MDTNYNPDGSLKLPTPEELDKQGEKLNKDFTEIMSKMKLPTIETPQSILSNYATKIKIPDVSNTWDSPDFGRSKNIRKWLIISSTKPPHYGFTDQQVYSALKKAGIKPIYIYDNCETELRMALGMHDFECIYWEGINGWNYWPIIKEYRCQKINTWYDDPRMRIDLMRAEETIKDGAKNGHVKFFVWDSYWCSQMLLDYGIDANECHLGASEDDYYTSNFSCDKYPVFIGAIHSQQRIDSQVAPLVEPFKTMIKYIENDLKTNSRIPSWDVYERDAANSLGDGGKRLFHDLCELDPDSQYRFRTAIWMMSKNQVRINMLRAAIEVSPIIMFADSQQINHADTAETKAMIGDTRDRIKFRDTTGIRSDKIGKFYHWSWIHLQATDPQSVNTGFPYRMFQTQASGRVLLTDMKPYTKNHFNVGETMVGYESPEELKEQLSKLMDNLSICKEIGKKAREEFEAKHTWHHRLDNFLI